MNGLWQPDNPLAFLVILAIAAAPIGEVRASIPVAIILYKMSWYEAFFWSFLGNVLVIPILWMALPYGEILVRKIPVGNRALNWVFARTRRKHSEKVERYEEAFLVLFVGIPLPATGVWMGGLITYLFGLTKRKAWPFMALGILLSCTVVTVLVVSLEYSFGIGP